MCEVDLFFWLFLLSLKVMTYFSTNLDPLFLTNLELLFYLLNSFDQVVHLLQGQWPPSWSLTKCFCRWSKACVSVVLWVIPALGISNTPVASYYNNIMYKLSIHRAWTTSWPLGYEGLVMTLTLCYNVLDITITDDVKNGWPRWNG